MIAILDYEAGNLTSVELAVRHVGGECAVTQDPAMVETAERIIFPGVGSAKACMANLKRLGLDAALRKAVAAGTPTLAICIGQQLLFDHSDEDGGVDCLGILSGEVKRFVFDEKKHVKIPHMGWNEVIVKKPHPLLEGLPEKAECYFVHSYRVEPNCPGEIFCETNYEGDVFASAVGEGNLFATQFHPEKSGKVGLGLLRNFLAWDGGMA